MRLKNLNELFEAHTDIKIDRSAALRVFNYVDGFMNKNEFHISFFSGNLFGVHPIRFLDEDRHLWFEEVLELLDPHSAQDDLNELDDINPNFKVTSSLFNMSCVWLAHMFYTSNLPDKEKELGVTYSITMLLTAHMCTLQTHRFKYPANEAIAMAVYESFTKKTDLRAYGSWRDLLVARSEVVLDRKFPHVKAMEKLETLPATRLLSDIITRENKMVNLMTERYHEFKDQKARIQSNSALIITEDGESLREYSNSVSQAKRDMADVMIDPNDLIREELVEATLGVAATANERYLLEVLQYSANNFRADKRLRELTDTLVVYLVEQSKSTKTDLKNIPLVVDNLVSAMRSSRVRNKDILTIRELAKEITEDSTSNNRHVVIVATQIAFVVYLTIRILTLGRYA